MSHNKLLKILLLISTCLFFSSCTSKANYPAVYSIYAENEFIKIENGILVISENSDKFSGGGLKGGTLRFKDVPNTKYKSLDLNYKFINSSKQEEIFFATTMIDSSEKETFQGVNVSEEIDIGTSVGSSEFLNSEIENIISTLSFEIKLVDLEGNNFTTSVPVSVEKFEYLQNK